MLLYPGFQGYGGMGMHMLAAIHMKVFKYSMVRGV